VALLSFSTTMTQPAARHYLSLLKAIWASQFSHPSEEQKWFPLSAVPSGQQNHTPFPPPRPTEAVLPFLWFVRESEIKNFCAFTSSSPRRPYQLWGLPSLIPSGFKWLMRPERKTHNSPQTTAEVKKNMGLYIHFPYTSSCRSA
jgi:hypothetical protein